MKPRFLPVLALSSFLLISLSARTGSAQAGAAADALFDSGKALLKEGKFQEACDKLEESLRLDPAGGTEIALGECNEGLKKTATAWSHYDRARVYARRAQKLEKELELTKRMLALESKIPKLAVNVPADVAALPGLEVHQDGLPLGKGAWGVPLPVDPGTHLLEATATGKEKWRYTIFVPDTGSKSFDVGPLQDVTKPAETKQADAKPEEPKHLLPPSDSTSKRVERRGSKPEESTQRYVGYSLGAAGVIATIVGGVLVAKSIGDGGDASSRETKCSNNNDANCYNDAYSDVHTAHQHNASGWVVTGLGLGALAGGALLIWTAPMEAPSSPGATLHLLPALSPTNAGASLTGRW